MRSNHETIQTCFCQGEIQFKSEGYHFFGDKVGRKRVFHLSDLHENACHFSVRTYLPILIIIIEFCHKGKGKGRKDLNL